MSIPQGPKLHLGCWKQTPDGWINSDGSWNAWISKHTLLRKIVQFLRLAPRDQANADWGRNVLVHDVRKPLPFPDNSLSVVYASHLLEHLHFEEGQRLLKECYRVLLPGGVVRMVVPDLRVIMEDYLAGKKDEAPYGDRVTANAADLVNHRLMYRPIKPATGSLPYRIYSALTDFHSHKYMYDSDSLAYHLQQIGFTEVAIRPYLDSRIPGLEQVEIERRVVLGGIAGEGIKPKG
jgi:SAM-dependent methyltransferase